MRETRTECAMPDEDERAGCRRGVPPGIEITDRPVLNWERFKGRAEAVDSHMEERVVLGHGWSIIEWLYMEYIPDERTRESYLRRLDRRGILNSVGYAELKRLGRRGAK